VQGAWAVLLSRYSGERDVLFGVTVSGREASIPGVEQGIGLFINTIPLRLQVDRDRGVPEWLKELQARQEELLRYGHSPLWHVQKWSEVEGGQPLFQTLLGFQNYPVDPSLGELATDLRVKSLGIRDKTNYPLVVLAAASGPHLYAPRLRPGPAPPGPPTRSEAPGPDPRIRRRADPRLGSSAS
jgi:non-ribosomal peptide synthetase component F